MKVNDMSIMAKLGSMSAILLFLLILVGWFGARGVTIESAESKKLSDLLGLDSTMLHREIDHIQWAAGVSSFLLNKNEATLSVGIDQNKCKLGKWLNDREEMATAEGLVPEVKGLLAKIKDPHAALHASAANMQGLLNENGGDREASSEALLKIYQADSLPALAGVRGTLHEISGLVGEHVKEQEAWLQSVEKKTKTIIVVLNAVAVVVGVAVCFFVSRLMSGQIREAVNFADTLAKGDFSKTLNISQKDEVGVLSKALNGIVKSLRSMVGEIQKSSTSLASASGTLSAVAEQMSSGAEQTSMRANTVASASEEMSVNMESVAAATEEAATNVNMVAAAAEEMTSTINEISANTGKTSTMAAEASTKAEQASQRVDELGQSAQEISKVTETITEISEQTNLLALNATIEAARAGEAGKGFAVVANEIKELAKQTAEATLEIRNNIEGVQVATSNTVKEINEVSVIIKEVNEMSTTVASAVEEQSATTQEIAGNVAQASLGIQEVTENIAQVATVTAEITQEITDVNAAANELNQSSTQVQENAADLKNLSGNLEELISSYKIS